MPDNTAVAGKLLTTKIEAAEKRLEREWQFGTLSEFNPPPPPLLSPHLTEVDHFVGIIVLFATFNPPAEPSFCD